MKIQTNGKFNFIKKYTKVTKSTGKEHNYVKVIDDMQEVHDFYIKPSLVDKLNSLNYLDSINLIFNVTYGTKDKLWDGLQIVDVQV